MCDIEYTRTILTGDVTSVDGSAAQCTVVMVMMMI